MSNKRQIGMWSGKVFGFEPSAYALEHNRLDYRTLSLIVGDKILANSLIENTAGVCGEWDIVCGCDYDEQTDEYVDVFQTYIITRDAARTLERLGGQLVYYNETLDLYTWGITHWGTSWDYVLTDIELVSCDDLDEVIKINDYLF